MTDMDLPGRIKRLRLSLGLSQKELAESVPAAKWSQATVGKIERGERLLQVEELALLAMTYGFSIDQFLDLESTDLKRTVLLTKASDELSEALDKINALLASGGA
jgi:transcriptional regulator with XRE-family HTH domain